MTAVEAKNTFGRLLEAAHREPVTVTKNNREIAAMFAMEDLHALADAFLAEPLKAEVAAGTRNVIDALMLLVPEALKDVPDRLPKGAEPYPQLC